MDDQGFPVTLTEEQMREGEEPNGEEPKVEPTGEQEPKVPEPKSGEQEEEQEIAKDPVVPEPKPEPKPGEGEEEQPVSRRESKRVNQLLEKLAQAEQGAQPQRGTPQRNDGTKPIIPDGEYDTDQVNQMAKEYGQRLYQQGLSQAQALTIANQFSTRIEIDAPRIAEKYPFLDNEAEDYSPGPTMFINRMYLGMVGYDPVTGVVENQNLRYGEFIDGFMDVVDLITNGKVADTSKNVAKQAAQTGVRPGGVSKSNYQGDDPRKMSDDQLDAVIAQGLGLRR